MARGVLLCECGTHTHATGCKKCWQLFCCCTQWKQQQNRTTIGRWQCWWEPQPKQQQRETNSHTQAYTPQERFTMRATPTQMDKAKTKTGRATVAICCGILTIWSEKGRRGKKRSRRRWSTWKFRAWKRFWYHVYWTFALGNYKLSVAMRKQHLEKLWWLTNLTLMHCPGKCKRGKDLYKFKKPANIFKWLRISWQKKKQHISIHQLNLAYCF